MTENRVDILKIDDRGRIVIPDEIRRLFHLSKKAYFIGIGKPNEQQITLTNLSESRETATFLLDSKVLPEDYESSMNEVAEKLWGLQAIIVKAGTSTKDSKKLMKDKIEQLREALPKEYMIKVIIIEENGRFVMPKSFRKILNVIDDSYILCLSNSKKKEMELYPFIGAKHIHTLRRQTKDGIEWVIKASTSLNFQDPTENPFEPI